MSDHPDGKRSRLRTMVADVEGTMTEHTEAPLRDAWRRLVAGLDLGPEPDVRTCPHCGGIGMRAASRCGHCWHALAPAA